MTTRSKPAQKLKPGQLSHETIRALETFIVAELGEDKRYKQLVDPASMRAAGAKHTRAPVPVPRFLAIVDTMEQDYKTLVPALRARGFWAVGRCMKRALTDAHEVGDLAGDFAALEFVSYDEDEDGDCQTTPEYRPPPGYHVHIDVERKEIAGDLPKSFGDSRRERQRAQQLASPAERHVMLIEGNINQLRGPMARWITPINTDMDNMTFSSDFHVRQINTHADLLPLLCNMVSAMAKKVLRAEAGIEPILAYSLSGKKREKVRDLDSPHIVWSGMLQAVPRISPAAAAAVQELYPTMLDFARDLVRAADSPDDREEITERLRDVAVKSQDCSSSRESTRFATRADNLMRLALGESLSGETPRKRPSVSSSSSVAKKRAEQREPSPFSSDDDDEPYVPAVKPKRGRPVARSADTDWIKPARGKKQAEPRCESDSDSDL